MPAPPSPMQSASVVQARPVVPSGTSAAVEVPVPASSKRWKIVPLFALAPLETPLAEPVDPRLAPVPAPLLPVPQSHAPNPDPSVRQLCAPRQAPGPRHICVTPGRQASTPTALPDPEIGLLGTPPQATKRTRPKDRRHRRT